ncbi:MAG: hypothetical protein GY913_21165 [Proteobacteria bacterium]|nr:hypothetical protein [Pseudomonadota bacterium]MCP4919419.1 hypothetical protein [Pseudomonadota bacterium]
MQLALDDAESAFEARDEEAFLHAMDRADETLPCVIDPATPALSAELHRMVGLRAFLERDEENAALAFAAARSVEPDYTFPLTVVPAHHPVQELYDELDTDRGTTMILAPASEGSLRIDGRRAERRSTSWPQLVQVVSKTGVVTSTDYVWPNEPRPSWVLQVEPRMRMFFAGQPAGAFYWMIGLPFTGIMGIEPEGQYPYTTWGPRGILGVTFGGGAMWSLSEKTGLFIEIPFTLYLLGHGTESQQSTLVYPQPSEPSTGGYLYSGTVGIQRRF